MTIQLSAQKSIEVNIDHGEGKLFGTLTISDTTSATSVVLMIAGSGPTDRDNKPGNSYKMLADSLALYGISSLRFDKRSSGESVKTLQSFDNISFEHFINDVKLWIRYLEDDSRFSEIIVLGHSQGSTLGILATQNSSVAKYISVAGPGETIDLVLKRQIYNPPINEFFFSTIVDSILNRLSRGVITDNDSIPLPFQSLFSESVQPFIMTWMAYDPCKEISKLNIPILIVQGEMDFQVGTEQYELLKSASPNADTLFVKNMNHALKFADTLNKLENSKNYTDPSIGILQELILGIVKFIKD